MLAAARLSADSARTGTTVGERTPEGSPGYLSRHICLTPTNGLAKSRAEG